MQFHIDVSEIARNLNRYVPKEAIHVYSVDHAVLQKQLKTPISLDESIHSFEDARKAVELGSTKVINVKIGRVGGLSEAKRIHDYRMGKGVPVWCGGMLEAGIGRAHYRVDVTSELHSSR